MISILKQFKGLKRLDLDYYEEWDKDLAHGYCSFPMENLYDLQGLTHLSINGLNYSEYYCTFKETILTDIDIKFPKLKYLSIDAPIRASEWSAQVLSKLSGLEIIKLTLLNIDYQDNLVIQLSKNCKHFIKFYLISNYF